MRTSAFNTLLLCTLVAVVACNPVHPGHSSPIFSKYAPASKEYRDELASRLRSGATEYVYTFNGYLEQNGKEYVAVGISGRDFTASGIVQVNSWHKMEGIKRTRGLGYHGAELKGFRLEIADSPSGATFIYKDLQQVVD